VSGAITLASLADRDVWVGWRTEARDGRATKIPFDPRTGQPAKSDDSRSWATCREAEFWAIKERGDGVGIMSCPVGDASLAAVDLDACRNTDTGDIAPCAQEIIDRLGTYAEVSPSGTGVTAFFAIANADLSAVEELFEGKHEARLAKSRHGLFPVPGGWQLTITPNAPAILPNQSVPITVSATPPSGFTGNQVLNVHAFHAGGIAGGVTLTINVL
jgi:hypothetical protein